MSQMTARQISPKVTVSVVFVVAMFMTIMDTTIVNVTLPTISRELSVPLDRVDGISIGFLVTLAVFIPASGWLGDRFGAKRVFLVALAIFTLASALCRQRHRADRSRRRAAGGRPRRRRDDAQPQATSPRRRSRHPRRRRADVTVTTTGQATVRERTALAGHSHHRPFGIREELPERTVAPPPGNRRGPRRGGANRPSACGSAGMLGRAGSVIDGTGHDDRRGRQLDLRALPVDGE